jgi:hypothetical protein
LERGRADLERALEDITRAHAGQSQPDVLDALHRAVARFGLTPHRADLSALARQISDATPADQ